MKVIFYVIGKTNADYLKSGCNLYEKRLKHYLPFHYEILPDVKIKGKMNAEQLKLKEGELLLSKLNTGDFLVLLDERGKQLDSIGLAKFMEKQLGQSHRQLIFVVGGAYGFSNDVYQRANMQLSLSKMTFSHQMIRLFFLEQIYRAMTILRNEPYHHA